MTNFVVFNELSLPLSDYHWQEQFGVFLQLISKLRDNGVMTIRLQQRFQDFEHFTQSKSLQALLGNTSGIINTRLKSFIANQTTSYESPLIRKEEQTQYEELTINSEYFFEGKLNTGGLACAHIWNTLVLSFATHEKWSATRFKLTKLFIDADEREVSISHLSEQSHCSEHHSAIQSLCSVPGTPEQLLSFCKIQNHAYPFKVIFTQEARLQLDSLESQNKDFIKRVYELIRSVKATPGEGIGKPELLIRNLSGYSSRRITDEHRLVYKLVSERESEVSRCIGHYE